MKYLFKKLLDLSLFLRKIEQIGTSSEVLSPVNIRIRLVNIQTLFSLVISFMHTVSNLLTEISYLTFFDFAYILTLFCVFYLNHRKHYTIAKVYLLSSTILLLTFLHVVHGDVAYHLLCVFMVTMVLFCKIWIQLLVCIFMIAALMLPHYWHMLAEPIAVPRADRLWLNVCIIVFYIFGLVRYFLSIQNRYQNQIKQQKNNLESLNQQKEQLFAIIAHDIRSPLLASSQSVRLMLQQEIPTGRIENVLNEVNLQLMALYDNTENLLNWSLQNIKEQIKQATLFQIKPLILEIICSMQLQIGQKNMSIDLHMDDPLEVFADREHVRIIVRNLINNALKFSHTGGRIQIISEDQQNKTRISITDFGIGIPADQLDNLFNKLTTPSFGTQGERGTGFGLLLVKNLVERNNGRISATSFENWGSRFTVELPANYL